MHRLDEKLLAAAVAQGAPRRPEPLRQGILTDDLMGPELIQEFVFGDDAIAALHEVASTLKLWRSRAQGTPPRRSS